MHGIAKETAAPYVNRRGRAAYANSRAMCGVSFKTAARS